MALDSITQPSIIVCMSTQVVFISLVSLKEAITNKKYYLMKSYKGQWFMYSQFHMQSNPIVCLQFLAPLVLQGTALTWDALELDPFV